MLMKLLKKDKLIRDFWDGKTTLDDEALLKRSSFESAEEKAYFTYLKSLAGEKSDGAIDSWNFIVKNRPTKTRFIARIAVAASIVFVIGIAGLSLHQNRKAELETQFALIEQTLNHVSTELTTTHSTAIIYEDDLIVIVAEN